MEEELRKNNTSGYPGVNWSEEKQKWHAKICVNYKRIHLGYFDDIEKAALAFSKAREKYDKLKKVK